MVAMERSFVRQNRDIIETTQASTRLTASPDSSLLSCEQGQVSHLVEDDLVARRAFLRKAAEDGHAPAMYQFALVCADTSQRGYWLRKAAKAGYVPAMYAFGFECENQNHRRRWLRKAAEEGHVGAMCTLISEAEDAIDRRRWLQLAAEAGHVPSVYEWGLACACLLYTSDAADE